LNVALFTGAWIEIPPGFGVSFFSNVALFTGAWIEITVICLCVAYVNVALFTGAWIEINFILTALFKPLRRALYGRVD